MSEIVIKVENLWKQYHLGVIGHGALYKDLQSWWARVRGKEDPNAKIMDHSGPGIDSECFWALRDISLEVEQGKVLGIVGRNGAGKSTLLKILSRVTTPTKGTAKIKGRIASLLEVGTGFHPELTGRENIYLNGTILGMSKNEIKRKFDEIVSFSEVEKFIDTPVKRYSSGMYVRLAFAVAAHLEPEILVVDEVLAVGDIQFRKKCLGKMGDVAGEGRTVLFVSHNMGAITRLCERALWIDEGCLCKNGPTEQVVSRYLTSGTNLDGQRIWKEGIANPGVSEFKLRAIRIRNSSGEITSMLDARKPFWVEIDYEILQRLPFCRIGVIITTVNGVTVFTAFDADREEYAGPREPGLFISRCKIPGYLLSPRRFMISCSSGIRGVKNLVRLENILSFDIEDTGAIGSHVGGRRQGIIRPEIEWQREVI